MFQNSNVVKNCCKIHRDEKSLIIKFRFKINSRSESFAWIIPKYLKRDNRVDRRD